MKNNIKIVFLSVIFSHLSFGQNLTLGAVINKAGRQRMLTQRMAKDYLLIGAEVRTEESLRELDNSMSTFDETLKELIVYAPTNEIAYNLEKVSNLWSVFRKEIISVPDINNASSIIKKSYELMNACNDVVEKIQNFGGVKAAVLPNICGKQRMLSQRLALLYVANYWKVPYDNIDKDLKDAINNFEKSLISLIDAKENNSEIDVILKRQQSEWEFLKKSFDFKSNNLLPGSINSSTNLMVKDFNLATTLYEKLIDSKTLK